MYGLLWTIQEPQLPPKNTFYSSLTEEDISKTDYTHAQRVFNHFHMTDLGDYQNLYLLTNLLLLADVFENFRDLCLQHYGLDPAHNCTSPGLSWEAALKMMEVELDLLTNIYQHLFIEERSGKGWKWLATETPKPTSLEWKITTPANAIAI